MQVQQVSQQLPAATIVVAAPTKKQTSGFPSVKRTAATIKFAVSCAVGSTLVGAGCLLTAYSLYSTFQYFVKNVALGDKFSTVCDSTLGSFGFERFCENLGKHSFNTISIEDRLSLGIFSIPLVLTASSVGIGVVMHGVRVITYAFGSLHKELYKDRPQ